MPARHAPLRVAATPLAVVLLALAARADVTAVSVHPTAVTLAGGDDAAQLVVTGTLADGRLVDLTHDATYAVADGKTASVTAAGRVTPLADGTSAVVAAVGGRTVSVPVTAAGVGENRPINFPNQVVPIFTKLGCNSGGCHGKATGQNGFKLSLLGFEPDFDYATLVKEARGRRLFPASPERSLFLLKRVGAVPHGGGRKMDPAGDEYRIVRRWIAAGTPYGRPTDPTVQRISVFPEHRVLARRSRQQFAVYAHYTDGTVEDITRRAQYESNEPEIAAVDAAGLVRTLDLSGEAAVMARYQGHVAAFRATVPLGLPTPAWTFPANTVVDTHTARKWRDLGLVPSAPAGDEAFVRRAYLDVTGTLPTPQQVLAFAADADPAKRERLIDRLVETPEYAYYFAGKWADVLRVKRRGEAARAEGTFAFHNWIRRAVADDLPYTDFVRAIVTATGDDARNPPAVWYKELEKPENLADDLSQVFLGQRLGCANCHHHPYEKWGQDDYWGLAAFFGRVGRKPVAAPASDAARAQAKRQVLFTKASGAVPNKRTGKPADAKPLDGPAVDVPPGDDPRAALADWMTAPANPFLARAVVNRYWAHFFGRGIVDPLDDMRATNPPSNPELLDALAKALAENRFSLKALVRVITKSRTYQLSAVPNEWNRHDKQGFARYYPKRLPAEVLLDAVNQVTDAPPSFNGLPKDANAPRRAIMLPDESFPSYFLEVFGRPQRASACECERSGEASLAQALHLLNSDEVQGKVSRPGGRADQLSRADDKRSDAEKVDELFLWAFGRKASADDRAAALAHVEASVKKAGPAGRRAAFENIVWAVINTKEFVFNQ